MLKPYWPYVIEKNWKYTLSEEVKHSNIFCYGRPGSGRTEKVAIPVAEAAIKEFRSCVIYAESTATEYAGIRQFALQQGYYIYALEDTSVSPEEAAFLAEEITDKIMKGIPTLVLISDRDFKIPAHASIVHHILSCVYKEGSQRYSEDFSSPCRENSTLFILDDLCGNTLFGSYYLKPEFLQFCIIMGSDIASRYWREKTIATILESPYIPETVIDQLNGNTTDQITQRFFLNVETVICTGINGIVPQEHREFIGRNVFGEASTKIGGRFIIEERVDPERTRGLQSLRPVHRLEIDQEDIENSTYGALANKWICAGDWICELHGRVWLFYDGSTY